jgi:metal-responsive CopG/Arc/MetJ family transcriptional regulator
MQGVRMPADLLAAVEEWRDDQVGPKPSRAEAIRQLLTEHLKAKGYLK